MTCPRCNSDKNLAIVDDALCSHEGPEGPLHVVFCTRCGWEGYKTSTPVGIERSIRLRNMMCRQGEDNERLY